MATSEARDTAAAINAAISSAGPRYQSPQEVFASLPTIVFRFTLHFTSVPQFRIGSARFS